MRPNLKTVLAGATVLVSANAAFADTWRYAHEEAATEVQGVFA